MAVAGSSQHLLSQAGVSLVEILIVLALTGLMAAMSIGLVTQSKTDPWKRDVNDYIHHLSALYNKASLQYGNGPVQALDSTGTAVVYADGIGTILETWETATYKTAPRRIEYPSKIVVYLDPDDSAVPDALNQITNDAGNNRTIANPSAITLTAPANKETIDDREFILIDMNGTDGPNDLTKNGDRVLLYVNDDTGQVLTAYQRCAPKSDPDGGGSLTSSDDTAHAGSGTLSGGGDTCTMNTRSFYRSFYDVFKGY